MFERGNIYRAIRDVLARKIMPYALKHYGNERIAYQIATQMIKRGEIPDKSKKSFWNEVKKEYKEQISMATNPNQYYDKYGLPIIARNVKAIEYIDVPKSKAEKLKNPYIRWRHDFKNNDIFIYGLPDGSLWIKSKKKKKLWDFR
ncbi:MAG: hypothetical protein QW474_01130 [Candidatus Aenigmatarchaeota archaeon]